MGRKKKTILLILICSIVLCPVTYFYVKDSFLFITIIGVIVVALIWLLTSNTKITDTDLIKSYKEKNLDENLLYAYNSEMIIDEKVILGALIATERGITFINKNEEELVEKLIMWNNIIGYSCDSFLEVYTKNADKYKFKILKGNELREVFIKYL